VTQDTVAIIAGFGALLGVIWTWMNIRDRFRNADRQSEGRFKELEFRTGMMWEIFYGDAKIALRRKEILQTNSPERLNSDATAHLVENGFGAKLAAFYRELIAKNPQVTEADGTWQLYIAFKPELKDAMMTPLAMNISEALVAAWQFCVDQRGGAEHD
jgi:hypothetical protein